ncbi:hypothetical protein FOA52_009757 [Chlamydomonas sp. UWO 241]|nr:hypothetical protein FOA52_009757 [Chlamydomonas sp. UWO 241]
MPPKVLSLALAGRRLDAPPEPYNPKRELAIKGWLRSVQQQPHGEGDLLGGPPPLPPDVEETQVLTASVEDLYRECDLRQSVDGTIRPQPTPGQHQPGAAPGAAAAAGGGGGGDGHSSPLGGSATLGGSTGGGGPPHPMPPGAAPGPFSTGAGGPSGAPFPPVSPGGMDERPLLQPRPAAGSDESFSPGGAEGAERLPVLPPPLQKALFDGVLAATGGLHTGEQRALEASVSLLLARAEGRVGPAPVPPSPQQQQEQRQQQHQHQGASATPAGQAGTGALASPSGDPGSPPSPSSSPQPSSLPLHGSPVFDPYGGVHPGMPSLLHTVDVLSAALAMAVLDKQRLQESARLEIQSTRQLAEAARMEADEKISRNTGDLAGARKRAEGAEKELAAVRAEAIAMQQALKGGDSADASARDQEHAAALESLQKESAGVAEKLLSQAAGAEATMRRAMADVEIARAAAQQAERKNALTKRELELTRSRMDMELAGARAVAAERGAQLVRAEADVKNAMAGWQAEAAARIEAESSERRALAAAARTAELSSAAERAAAGADAAKRLAELAAARPALLRAHDPMAPHPPQQLKQHVAGGQGGDRAAGARRSPRDASAATAAAGGHAPGGHTHARPSPARAAGAAAPAAAGGGCVPGGGGGGGGEPSRAAQHAGLARMVAQERLTLIDAQRLQRRSELAVQLAESRAAEQALANAPEPLRSMGLAFRGYIVAAPGAPLPDGLSTRYRLFADPLLQADPLAAGMVMGAPLVRISACLLLLPSAGLLSGCGARAAITEAADCGIPIVVADAAASPGTAPASDAEVDRALRSLLGEEAAAKRGGGAGVAAAGDAATTGVPPLPEHARAALSTAWAHCRVPPGALAAALGPPDAAFAALAGVQLKASSSSGGTSAARPPSRAPDLAHLNHARRGCTLKVVLLPDEGGTASPAAASAPAAGAAEGGCASGSGGGTAAGVGIALRDLLACLAGNTTVTTLSLAGCSASQARALAAGIATFPPSSALENVVVAGGTELPLGLLLRPGAGGGSLAAIDLSTSRGMGPEDAVLLAAGLRAPGASGLQDVRLPTGPLSARMGSPDGAAAVAELAGALAALPQLARINGTDVPRHTGPAPALDLSGCALGPIAGGVLLARRELGERLGSARALNLTGCGVGQHGAEALAAHGGHLRQLSHALLADNGLGPLGVQPLCAALSSPSGGGALAVLDLSLNALGDSGVAALVAGLLPRVPQLQVLALGSNGISASGAASLAGALPALPQLQQLLLPGNSLGDPGVSTLAAALAASCPLLASLSLAGNRSVGEHGARALSELLASSTALTLLDLGKCSVGAGGARHLAKAVGAGSCPLRSLDLSGNRLRAEGAQMLSAHLGASGLTHLGLDRNSLGDRGIKALVEALQHNASLTRLELRSNSIGLVGLRLLTTLLRDGRNTALNQLCVGGNDADDEMLAALEALASAPRTQRPQPQPLAFPTSSQQPAVVGSGVTSRPLSAPSSRGVPPAMASVAEEGGGGGGGGWPVSGGSGGGRGPAAGGGGLGPGRPMVTMPPGESVTRMAPGGRDEDLEQLLSRYRG